jgi:hypothetical protein
MVKKKTHIDLETQRYGMFMSENSFNLDVSYGRNYLQSDIIHEIILYKINVTKSKSNNLYGQSKPQDKIFFPPVKIKVMVTVEPSETTYYGNNDGGIARDDTGKLVFGVYLKELEENNIDIQRGDYVGYNMSGDKMRFYEVEDANNVIDVTDKTIGGFKPYWRKITAVSIKEDVIPQVES